MKELFPAKQVMGFVFSLLLTVSSFGSLLFGFVICSRHDDSFITAFVQAVLQLVVFMHAGETKDKWSIYGNVYFYDVSLL